MADDLGVYDEAFNYGARRAGFGLRWSAWSRIDSPRMKWLGRLNAAIPTLLAFYLGLGSQIHGAATGKDPSNLAKWIDDHYISIALVVGIVNAVLGLVAVFGFGRRRAIQQFLKNLHTRNWSKAGGRDDNYRVSLCVLRWSPFGSHLSCFERTGPDGKSSKKWLLKPKKDEGGGVVARAWHTGMQINVPSLKASATPDDEKNYRENTFVSPEQYNNLSWPGAAMMGVTVRGDDGEELGVLLVERKSRDGTTITVGKEFAQEAHLCAMILKGRL